MTSNDALERLKRRNRPTVPNRDASLVPDALISGDVENSISSSRDISVPGYLESLPLEVKTPEVMPPKAEPVVKPEIPLPVSSVPTLLTKQSTLRLEQGVSDRLQDLCRQRELCREVLIEAMFEYCESNQDVMELVLSKAREKNERRQQIANLKRAQSMMQRFGQSGIEG